MAIFGVGSIWDDDGELAPRFFETDSFILGWGKVSAEDLYSFVASLKAGDILYLKSNQPGSRTIRVKGIGLVKESFISGFDPSKEDFKNPYSFSIPVAWICQEPFKIVIPEKMGKMTNIRAATVYEEYLPYVQAEIIAKIIAAKK